MVAKVGNVGTYANSLHKSIVALKYILVQVSSSILAKASLHSNPGR